MNHIPLCGPHIEPFLATAINDKKGVSIISFSSSKNLNNFLLSPICIVFVIHIYSINNRGALRETGISFISFQGASKILFFPLHSTLGLTHSLVKGRPLPALQMLDAPQTLEATVYHDGHACAQRFTLLHAGERQERRVMTFYQINEKQQ